MAQPRCSFTASKHSLVPGMEELMGDVGEEFSAELAKLLEDVGFGFEALREAQGGGAGALDDDLLPPSLSLGRLPLLRELLRDPHLLPNHLRATPAAVVVAAAPPLAAPEPEPLNPGRVRLRGAFMASVLTDSLNVEGEEAAEGGEGEEGLGEEAAST